MTILHLLHVAKNGQSKVNQAEDEGCYRDGQHISFQCYWDLHGLQSQPSGYILAYASATFWEL